MELCAAALRPEVQRDASGVTELEFVICMAIELGMVEMKQLQPFIDQFRQLDIIGNGRLGMEDLRAGLRLQRQMKRATTTTQTMGGGSLLRRQSANGSSSSSSGGGTGLAALTGFLKKREDNLKSSSGHRLQIESAQHHAKKTRRKAQKAHNVQNDGRWKQAVLKIQRNEQRRQSGMGTMPPPGEGGDSNAKTWRKLKGVLRTAVGRPSQVLPPNNPQPVVVGGDIAWSTRTASGTKAHTPLLLAKITPRRQRDFFLSGPNTGATDDPNAAGCMPASESCEVMPFHSQSGAQVMRIDSVDEVVEERIS